MCGAVGPGLGCAPPERVRIGEAWRKEARAGSVPGGVGIGTAARSGPGCCWPGVVTPWPCPSVVCRRFGRAWAGTGRGCGASGRDGRQPERSRSAARSWGSRRVSKPKRCLLTGAYCNRLWRFPRQKARCVSAPRSCRSGAQRERTWLRREGWAASCLKASGLKRQSGDFERFPMPWFAGCVSR